jgi:hypothetical protein
VLVALAYYDNRGYISFALQTTVQTFIFFIQALLVIAIVVALAVLFYVLWERRQKVLNEIARQRDGSHALRIKKDRDGREHVLNPGHMVSSSAIFVPGVGWKEIEPEGGYTEQFLMVRMEAQRTAHLQAMIPGDEVLKEQPMAGRGMGSDKALKALNGKAPSDQQKALPASSTNTADVYEPYIAMTGVEALRQATPSNFILGQAQNGALCKVDLHNAQHMGIVGAPGCGKTVSTAYSAGFSVFNFGGRLIVLDGKDGIDWKMWARVAEHHMMDSGVLADQMHYVHQEYVRRMAMVARYNVQHLSKLEHPDFPSLYVIVEEYGANASGMNKKDAAFCDGIINEMTQKGRVTDIHLVIIDQDPRYWSPLLLMCTKAKILYKVGPNQGNVVGDYHAQELPDTGVFRYQKVEYNAWLMEGERDKLLERIPTNPWPPLMPDVTDWKQPLFPGNAPNPPIAVQKPGQTTGQMSRQLSAPNDKRERPGSGTGDAQKGMGGGWKPVDPQQDAGMGARGQTGVLGVPMRSGERSGENGGIVSTGGRPTTRTDRTPDSTPNRAGDTENTRYAENSGQNTPDTEEERGDRMENILPPQNGTGYPVGVDAQWVYLGATSQMQYTFIDGVLT